MIGVKKYPQSKSSNYMDSVFSFLVVSEIFLCENLNLSEGEMYVKWIKGSRISAESINLFNFMIIETNQIYDNITDGFKSWSTLLNYV